jgi:hypothetical protein
VAKILDEFTDEERAVIQEEAWVDAWWEHGHETSELYSESNPYPRQEVAR